MNSSIWHLLPLSIKGMIESLPNRIRSQLEEIRVREGRPLEVITPIGSWFISAEGRTTSRPEEGYCPNRETCGKMLNLISNHSLYAMEEELRRGYVTIQGGHRIGLVGRVVVEGGQVQHLREVTGFNIRIARQVKGIAEPLLPKLMPRGRLVNLLLISPPQCGKTTLLRDLARAVSVGTRSLSSQKVGIVDERSEIAGCVGGVPQHDVGPRTDVLDGCPKAEGMMMMIRSMSPDLLVVDEIGRQEDSEAIFEAIHAGVHLFTTAHGRSMEEVCRRPALARLVEEGVFGRYLILGRTRGPGTVEAIYDERMNHLVYKGEGVG
ncbi:stage III sporulation protein AA [Marininema halotolerans]|uniref:Stage III sporulation protein AA n=1 Tax=Marininema halotolerans TaxID=1155944 RepID=A0A1I6TVV5_9BACL|nr:stage III sporulation protein AA [Marininema halotolerans]SFS93363.1 stage III sporulation protein AA [Marininema halotolerans]